jgi:hypothetical protein
MSELKDYKFKFFRPMTNITAYGLAQIVIRCDPRKIFYGVQFTAQQWEKLEPSLKRHFQDSAGI